MRKLIVSTLMSLDGVVGAPEKLLPHWDEENKAHAVEELHACDAFFFGRVTYDIFAARWPSVKNDVFAEMLNTLPKYVASRTLRQPAWQGSIVLSDAAELGALKKQPGKNIMKYGLGDVDRALIEQKLIDEIRVSVVPVVIGAGRRLFEGLPSVPLRFSRVKTFNNGILRISYDVVKL
jgi:dihydrofolate reductase